MKLKAGDKVRLNGKDIDTYYGHFSLGEILTIQRPVMDVDCFWFEKCNHKACSKEDGCHIFGSFANFDIYLPITDAEVASAIEFKPIDIQDMNGYF